MSYGGNDLKTSGTTRWAGCILSMQMFLQKSMSAHLTSWRYSANSSISIADSNDRHRSKKYCRYLLTSHTTDLLSHMAQLPQTCSQASCSENTSSISVTSISPIYWSTVSRIHGRWCVFIRKCWKRLRNKKKETHDTGLFVHILFHHFTHSTFSLGDAPW